METEIHPDRLLHTRVALPMRRRVAIYFSHLWEALTWAPPTHDVEWLTVASDHPKFAEGFLMVTRHVKYEYPPDEETK